MTIACDATRMPARAADDDDHHPYCDQQPSHFHEKNAVMQMIRDALETGDDGERECTIAKLVDIFDRYQEAPTLLDAHLTDLTRPLVERLKDGISHTQNVESIGNVAAEVSAPARLLYQLCKVRGWKVMGRFFHHEVADLLPLIQHLESIMSDADSLSSPSRTFQWYVRYAYLLWLSLVILVPFDLARFGRDAVTKQSVAQRLYTIVARSLSSNGPERDLAAEVLARLIARQDEHCAEQLPKLIDALRDHGTVFAVMGVARSLASLFEYAPVSSAGLLTHETLDSIFSHIQILSESRLFERNASLRKLVLKLTSRLGMYQLAVPLDAHHPERMAMVERVVELLLGQLADRDSIIRWCASKNLAKICAKLDGQMCDEVVDALLDMLGENCQSAESHVNDYYALLSDQLWHGCILAVAELARRSLISEDCLSDGVMPYVIKALAFEQQKPTFSIGAHVRDAACYACWSFARGYRRQVFGPEMDRLSTHLLCAALTDREVNVRRAAIAAFQEGVGRLGNFRNGIEIISLVDFFSVGQRQSCFTDLIPRICLHDQYRRPLIDRMWTMSRHWDVEIRRLAAEGLRKVAETSEHAAAYVINDITNQETMLKQAFSGEPSHRHGCALVMNEVAKFVIGSGHPSAVDFLARLKAILLDLLARHRSYITGFNVAQYVESVCVLVSTLCHAPNNVLSVGDMEQLFQLVYIGLENSSTATQVAAADAFGALLDVLMVASPELFSKTIHHVVDRVQHHQNAVGVRGFVAACGRVKLPRSELKQHIALMKHVGGFGSDAKLPPIEVRCMCVESLAILMHRNRVADPKLISTVLGAYSLALDDYTTDHRGDVGSWLRKCSILAAKQLVLESTVDLSPESLNTIVDKLLRLSVERIGKVRDAAILGLQLILPVASVADDGIDKLRLAFSKFERSGSFDELTIFTYLVPLLDIRLESVLAGLVVSVGDLTESTTNVSSSALLNHLDGKPKSYLEQFVIALKDLLRRNYKRNRVSTAILETLDVLLRAGALDVITDGSLFSSIWSQVLLECQTTKDTRKLNAASKVVSASVFHPAIAEPADAWSCLSFFLKHTFPAIRAQTANHLFVAATMSIHVHHSINVEVLSAVLTETDWLQSVDELNGKIAEVQRAMCSKSSV